MFVDQIMTRDPVTVSVETPVNTALATLRRHVVHQLPVIDSAGRLVGIVTDRDLRSATGYDSANGVDLLVEDVMTSDPLAVTADASLDQALSLLCTRRFNALPVVGHGKIVGIVTRQDVLVAFHDMLDLAEHGHRIEIALPRGIEDLGAVLGALTPSDHVSSIVAGRLRSDGQEPVLTIHTHSDAPYDLERRLRARGAILLMPEHPTSQP